MLQFQPAAKGVALNGGPLLIFVAVWAFRWLSMGALENDHFVSLARAHQVLHGDWPVRDFADPGQPLTYLASAAASWLLGPSLLTEVVLSITLLSLAAALTYVLAARASGSLLIAVAAVGVELIAAPRLYNAGKILMPLAAMGLGWHYLDAPSIKRLTALAAWTAIAGLWRHDLMVYIAAPALVMFALYHDRQLRWRRAGLFVALTAAFLLPWLIYVQWAVGIVDYAATAFRFAATEAERTVVWPANALATFVAVIAIPLIAASLAWRANQRLSFAHVAFAALMSLAADLALLRDVIATRLPDVIALTTVLAAFVAGRVVPSRVVHTAGVLAFLVVVGLVSVRLASQGYGTPTPGKVVRRFAAVARMLRQEAPDAIPNRERLPLIRYLATCTPAESRVLVSGFGPELPVLARRPFAAGLPSWIPGYHTHPRDVQRALAQLAREQVSMAVMLEGSAAFVDEWPQLASELRARRMIERTWRLDGRDVVVWIPAELAARAPSAPPPSGS
jgi:hypothetical protein